MDARRWFASLLSWAGGLGLGASLLACLALPGLLHAWRGWTCTYDHCTRPLSWGLEQTIQTALLSLGVLRSVLQIRAGRHLARGDLDRRGPLVGYLAVAALDCVLLALWGVPPYLVMILVAWPLAMFAVTRAEVMRFHVWEDALPRARLVL